MYAGTIKEPLRITTVKLPQIGGPLLQGVKWPPSKNTILGSSRFVGLCWCRISKKVRFYPPADGPPGDKTALFSKKSCEHGPTNRELPEKMVKNRGTLFLDQVPGPLLDSKVLKKTVHHPHGATSDALQRVYFVSSVSLLPKYILWRASEVAP